MVAKQQSSNEELQDDQAVEGELVHAETDPAPEDAGQTEDTGSHQQELERLSNQVQENLDKVIRAQAELDNVRKRSLRDVENAHKYALEHIYTYQSTNPYAHAITYQYGDIDRYRLTRSQCAATRCRGDESIA